jgi:hypothetical protein
VTYQGDRLIQLINLLLTSSTQLITMKSLRQFTPKFIINFFKYLDLTDLTLMFFWFIGCSLLFFSFSNAINQVYQQQQLQEISIQEPVIEI